MSEKRDVNFDDYNIYVLGSDNGMYEAHFTLPDGREFACGGFATVLDAEISAKEFIRTNIEVLEGGLSDEERKL